MQCIKSVSVSIGIQTTYRHYLKELSLVSVEPVKFRSEVCWSLLLWHENPNISWRHDIENPLIEAENVNTV